MKYSMTISGILIAIIGPVLVNVGLSESCSSEVTAYLPVLIGGIIAWIGRYRKGDITVGGFRK